MDIGTMTDEEFEEYMRKVEDEEESTADVSEETTIEESETDVQEDNTDTEEDAVEETTDNTDNEDLEQPEGSTDTEEDDDSADESDTDSNDDDEGDDEGDKDDSEEDSEDGESTDEPNDEQPGDEGTKEPEQEPKTEMHKIRADGQDLELTTDELKILASKGVNYGRKTQELSKYRKSISALKEAEIGDDELNLLIDAYRGDKAAIGKLFEKNQIDPLEYEKPEQEYQPTNYGKSDVELDLQEVVENISKDPEYDRTQRVLASEWDETSWNQLVDSMKDPSKRLRDGATFIEGVHRDIKNGMYDKIMPIQKKLKLFGGNSKSDFDYYMEAIGVYQSQLAEQASTEQSEPQTKATPKVNGDKIAKVKAQEKKRNSVKSDRNKRKAATTTKTGAGKRDIIDYLDDMNDSDFEKEMDKILKG